MGGVSSHKNNSDDEDDNHGITFMLPIPEWDLLNMKEASVAKSSTPRENLRRKPNVSPHSERNICIEANDDDLMTRYHKDCQKYICSSTDVQYRNREHKVDDDDDEYCYDDGEFTEDEFEPDQDDIERRRKNSKIILKTLKTPKPTRIKSDNNHDSDSWDEVLGEKEIKAQRREVRCCEQGGDDRDFLDKSLETQKSIRLPLRTSTFYKGKELLSTRLPSIQNLRCSCKCQRIIITRLVESETSENEDVRTCLCFMESFDSGLNSAQESADTNSYNDSDSGTKTFNSRVLRRTCKFRVGDVYKEMYTTNKRRILISSNESIESLDGSASGQTFLQQQSTSIREKGHTSFESGRGSLLSGRTGFESNMSICYSSDDISLDSGTLLKNSFDRSQLTGSCPNIKEMESDNKLIDKQQDKLFSDVKDVEDLKWKSRSNDKNTKYRDTPFYKTNAHYQKPESDSDTGHHCSITNSSSSVEELHCSISDSGINEDAKIYTWRMERKEDYCTVTRRLARLNLKCGQHSTTVSTTSAGSNDETNIEIHNVKSLPSQIRHDCNSLVNTYSSDDNCDCVSKANKASCCQNSNRLSVERWVNRQHVLTFETSTDSESNTENMECNMDIARRRGSFKSGEGQILNSNRRRGSSDILSTQKITRRRGSLNDVQKVQNFRKRRGSLKSSEEQNLPNLTKRRSSLNSYDVRRVGNSKKRRDSIKSTNDQQHSPRLVSRRSSLNLQDSTRCQNLTRRRRSLNSSDIQTLSNMSPGYLADNDDSNDAGFHSNDQGNSSDLSTSPPVRIRPGWDSFRVNRVRIKTNRCRCRCRKRSDQRQKLKDVNQVGMNYVQDSSDRGVTDEDYDGDGDGYATDNTYESIQVHPTNPKVKPYKCVDIKKLINQGQIGREPKNRPSELNLDTSCHGNLLRGYKYDQWQSPSTKRCVLGKGEIFNIKQEGKLVHPVLKDKEFLTQNRDTCRGSLFDRNADFCCSRGELYGRNGDYSGSHSSSSGSNGEMYGRHFGLIGNSPDVYTGLGPDFYGSGLRDASGVSEVSAMPLKDYTQRKHIYASGLERHRELLLRYGYDVTDPEYVLNDPMNLANQDVSSTVCENGGNETDNTYESIHVMSDPNDKVESAHDSSSGIASDVASYYPQTNMSTFKGDNTGSDKTSEDSGRKSVSWASNLDSPRSSNHYVQMHMNKQQRQSPITTALKQKQTIYSPRLKGEKIGVDLQDTGKLFLSSKGKHVRPSPFDLLSDDVVLKILSYLPSDHLCRCARVSRQWYQFVWEPLLWTKIVINNKNINVDKALKILTKRLGYNTPYVCVILERINLNGCELLTDKGLLTIAKRCPELRHLTLQGCHNITNNAIFELVSNCVNLEHFDLTGCASVTCISLLEGAVSHGTPRHQQQIYLRYLDMTDCYALEDEGLGIIAMHCSQLQFLYLRRCVRITDESMQYLANYCSTLRELSVSDCRQITDLGLRDLSKLGDNLRYLSVAKCDRMSDVGVRYLAKFCSKLRYLNVRGCEGVSDESLELLSVNCPRIRSLDVGKCDISDQGLLVLAQNCPQLRKLSLKSCDSITDKGVVQLAYSVRGLQQLNIQDCNISVEGYKLVKRYCRRCIIEHTNPAFY